MLDGSVESQGCSSQAKRATQVADERSLEKPREAMAEWLSPQLEQLEARFSAFVTSKSQLASLTRSRR